MNIIIPMSGRGSRFTGEQYLFPKPILDVMGKPMIVRAVESLDLDGKYHFVCRENEFLEETKEAIKSIGVETSIIVIDEVTDGPASTALVVEPSLKNASDELIIANCDQIMEWSGSTFLLNARQYDGCLVTYHSDTDKNSYCEVSPKGKVIRVREKEVISNISSNGIHYWKRWSSFISSANAMISANDRAPNGEFYIAPSYNYMISVGEEVGIYHVPNQFHHAVGVPFDLERYVEYATKKTQ